MSNAFSFSKKKRNLKEKTVYGSILFTDIVKSSRLWKLYKDKMFDALKKHEQVIYRLTKKYNGMVVKTIGDSFMLMFKSTKGCINAIRCALDIQTNLHKHPITLGKSDKIRLRIGISQGKLMKQHVIYQGVRLKDYFGETVNIASRMESKASENCKIAFSINDKYDEGKLLKRFQTLLKPDWKIRVKDYRENCNKLPKKRIRSSRLIQGYECLQSEKLKGVGAIRVYLFTHKH